MLDHPVAAILGLARMHGVTVHEHRTREQVAVLAGVGLEELRREAVGEIVEDIVARRTANGEIAPFAGGNLREPPLHEGLGGRDQLDDGGPALCKIVLDRADQRGHLHRRDEVIEKALLIGLERGMRCGVGLAIQGAPIAGDVRGLQGRAQVLMDDLKG